MENQEYKKFYEKYKPNESNNETLIKCPDNSYDIYSPYKLYVCNQINKDYRLKYPINNNNIYKH